MLLLAPSVARARQKGSKDTDEGVHDEDYLGSGFSDRLIMHKCSCNLIIGRGALVRSPKPGFQPVKHCKTQYHYGVTMLLVSNIFPDTSYIIMQTMLFSKLACISQIQTVYVRDDISTFLFNW